MLRDTAHKTSVNKIYSNKATKKGSLPRGINFSGKVHILHEM